MFGLISSVIAVMASNTVESLRHFLEITVKTFREKDPKSAHSLNYWIYLFSGFWKYESTTEWKTNLYSAYKYAIILIYGVSVSFFMVDAIIVRKDFDKLSFNMSSSVLVATKLLQIFFFSNLIDDLEELYDKLENNFYEKTVGESEEDKAILNEKAKIILKLSVIFYSLLIIGFPLRVMADTAWDSRLYLIPVPFKELIDDHYEFIYAQQAIISFHFMMTTLSFDLVGFSIVIRLIAHYEILEKNFQKITELYPKRNFELYVRGYSENIQERINPDVLIRKTNYMSKMQEFLKSYKLERWSEGDEVREEKTFQMLTDNIRHHQKLLAGVRTFSNAYSKPMLIQLFGMALLVGIAILQILFISKGLNLMVVQQLLYVLTTLINILYLCSFGSELTSKSISATNALYDTPWYDMSISNRNIVNLMLEKLAQAPVLRGGGMINIDRPICVKFFQNTYNMVALLRNKI